jgi:23S rRNA (pseudouridine1915-N3)-methyltransferase
VNIDIIAVGKIKENYLQEGIREYKKRLMHICRLNIIEVHEEKSPEGLSEAQKLQLLEKEGSYILKKLDAESFTVALCIEGEAFSSEQMAARLQKIMLSGKSRITFLIGGSLGLSDQIKSRADLRLSFSDFTLPHQLMRLVLIEQIYRWFKIMRGETYHK